MKIIALSLMLTLLLSACSSGTTASPVPSNVTSRFQGNFQNTPGTQSGTVTLDLTEDAAGNIAGNIIFASAGPNCLQNATVAGNTSGFSVTLEAPQSSLEFTITTRVEELTEVSDGMGGTTIEGPTLISETTRTSSTGNVGTTVSESVSGSVTRRTTVTTTQADTTGTLTFLLTSSNDGSNLSGTYTVSGDTCSNATGSGTISVSR